MKLHWQIEPMDVATVRSLLELHQDDPFLRYRMERNLRKEKPEVMIRAVGRRTTSSGNR